MIDPTDWTDDEIMDWYQKLTDTLNGNDNEASVALIMMLTEISATDASYIVQRYIELKKQGLEELDELRRDGPGS